MLTVLYGSWNLFGCGWIQIHWYAIFYSPIGPGALISSTRPKTFSIFWLSLCGPHSKTHTPIGLTYERGPLIHGPPELLESWKRGLNKSVTLLTSPIHFLTFKQMDFIPTIMRHETPFPLLSDLLLVRPLSSFYFIFTVDGPSQKQIGTQHFSDDSFMPQPYLPLLPSSSNHCAGMERVVVTR